MLVLQAGNIRRYFSAVSSGVEEMTKVSPRSVNIREIERAQLNIEHAAEHCLSVLNSYAAGVAEYEALKMTVPDMYYFHGAQLADIEDLLAKVSEILSNILKEM